MEPRTTAPLTGLPADGAPVAEAHRETAETRTGLLRAGAHGVLWQGLAQVVGKVVVLLTTVVMARLLAPHEFGLVSLALVLITYAEAFADAGVAQALVYLPRTRATLRAALLSSAVAGVLLMLVAIAAAPVVAAFFHRSDVAPLTRLLSVYLLAASLGALPESLLRRDLLFRRLTGATVARVLITGVVSVGLALSGLGAWALAWGTVAGAIGYAAATWVLLPVKPDLAFWRADRREVGRVLGYGIPVAGGSLLSKLIFNVDYLIIGRMLGATALGYYTLAFRIPELVIINVFFVLSGVAFPMFSRLRGDLGRMGNAYLFSVRLYSLYGLCAGVGLAVVGSLAIPLVFGARWQAAVAPLIPLALYAACRSIGTGANDVYKAIGRPGLAVSLSLLRLAVLVPALVAGARFGGIVGVAWAQVGAALAMAVVMQARAARVLVLRISRLGRAIVPGLLGAAAVLVVGTPLSRLHLAPPVALVLAVSGAVAGVVLVLVLFQRPLLRDLLAMARRQPRAAA